MVSIFSIENCAQRQAIDGNNFFELSDIQTRNIINMPFGRNWLATTMTAFIQASQGESRNPVFGFHSRVLNVGQVTDTNTLYKLYKTVFKIGYGTEMLDNKHLNSKGVQKITCYLWRHLPYE